MKNFLGLEKALDLGIYTRRNIVLVKGENARVWDDKGKEYIDCVGGLGVASLGQCNKSVINALVTQAKELVSCSNLFYNNVRALFLQKLVSITPGDDTRVFLCNSGTESVEAAIKLARYTTGKTGFICAEGAFHGRTMGALSATFNPGYREPFMPLVPGFQFVPYGNFEKTKDALDRNTAGIILEIVQGEGGVNLGGKEFFLKVRELCDHSGILLIIDEVQTGFCRTGQFFACNHFGLEPDLLCLAKAMGGGIPIGAVVCSAVIESPKGKHGSTFGGNPLACAAAIAAIDYMIEHKLDVQAKEKGDYLTGKLKQVSLSPVIDIRHLGLMIGIELDRPVDPFIQKLEERGVLVLSAGSHVLRLLPPLTIGYKELDIVAEALMDVMIE